MQDLLNLTCELSIPFKTYEDLMLRGKGEWAVSGKESAEALRKRLKTLKYGVGSCAEFGSDVRKPMRGESGEVC